ncbi:MAG: cytidine deaminase [Anaerolineales bacterium]|nr:cytidine deaminase [Anaerolineales bacterium]MCS7248407.1 cytidine deaminase [Anaerolineales bacterium]MDW8162220.1 cytidine deaminase [Anaerolineales bacterium]MDW8446393.1 cytidine deaminase [Anaerolineales bacterium]
MLSDEMRQKLIESALEARHWAYAPYSGYTVGAALLTASGRIYDGVNVENAAYPNTICAEQVAVFKAVSEGEREFIAIAVVTSDGGAPCGSCRQVLSEFGLETLVLIADENGNLLAETTVRELLPNAFRADWIKKSPFTPEGDFPEGTSTGSV